MLGLVDVVQRLSCRARIIVCLLHIGEDAKDLIELGNFKNSPNKIGARCDDTNAASRLIAFQALADPNERIQDGRIDVSHPA